MIHTVLLHRKLQEAELENALLRDPDSRANRLQRLGYPTTLATSGHFGPSATSLLACIKIIHERAFLSESKQLGAGRFGVCYLRTLSHYKTCVKVFKRKDNSAFCQEANMLSEFIHPNLPYLFGVCVGDNLAVVTSFHGFSDHSVTVHSALFSNSSTMMRLVQGVDWKGVMLDILSGLEHLHSRCKILHNDLKDDNIALSKSMSEIRAVIVDFGKACKINEGKYYSLTFEEKKRYKTRHPQIAPDLCDGRCRQSVTTDIYSIGRVLSTININASLNNEKVKEICEQCKQYSGSVRPDIVTLKNAVSA